MAYREDTFTPWALNMVGDVASWKRTQAKEPSRVRNARIWEALMRGLKEYKADQHFGNIQQDNLDNLINLSQGPIDGVFVGPNDLSTSMGIPDELERQEYLDTLAKIVKISESYNIPMMVHGFSEERTLKTMEIGARFVLHSSDGGMITGSIAREFNAIRNEEIEEADSDAI